MAEETGTPGTETTQKWPVARMASLIGVVVVAVVVFAVIILQSRTIDKELLYADLEPGDAAPIIEWLKERKVPYVLEKDGRSIYINSDRIHEVRIELAGAGLPTGGIGFEIFDQQSFGITDFTQQVNYRRALEGELIRSISSLAPVKTARIHLAIPEKRILKSRQKKASASVVLQVERGKKLNDEQVMGIIHLVAGSIPELDHDQVTVIDSNGKVLSRGAGTPGVTAASPDMLSHQRKVEVELQNRAQDLLDQALGLGNSQVTVTAKIDFSRTEKTEEVFDPNGAVVRSEQTSQLKSGASSGSGAAGVASNIRKSRQGGGNNSSSSQKDATTNYEISKTLVHTVEPTAKLEKLSVSVLVADHENTDEEGQISYKARTVAELQNIEDIIRTAVGIEDDRGDQINVRSMPFKNKEIFKTDPNQKIETPAYQEYIPFVKYGLTALGILLLYLLILRPLLKGAISKDGFETPMKTVREMERDMGAIEDEEEMLEDSTNEIASISNIKGMGGRNEAKWAQVIRRWIREGS